MYTTLHLVIVAGEVISRSVVSIIILKLEWTFSLVPLDNDRSFESSKRVLKFYIVSDLNLLSRIRICTKLGFSNEALAIFSTTPICHRPTMFSPRKYFKSTLLGENISTLAAGENPLQYYEMMVDLDEVSPITIVPSWGASLIDFTL